MIKQLFIPEKIGTYYLLQKRIIGFDIGKTSIKASQILLKSKEIIIERFFEVTIPVTTSIEEYNQRCSQAIKSIVDQVSKYDEIRTSLSSAQVIFKELKLPFINKEKIKLIIEHEIEPLLPFSLNDAVIDFIVTKENAEEKSSEVLVAAVQNQYIAQHLALFDMVGISPEVVTVDLIALYGFYKQIPAYESLAGGIVLLEMEPYITRMIYIYDGQLRLIRTINKGLIEQAKAVAQLLKATPEEAMEHIIRYGMEPDHNVEQIKAIKAAFTSFFKDITFTLQSFIAQARPAQSINKIIVFGTSAVIKGLPQLITELTATESEILNVTSFLHDPNKKVTAKNSVPQTNIISLATALPSPITNGFNLRQKEFALSEARLLNTQLAIAIGLALAILTLIIGNSFWQIRKLKSEIEQSQQEVVTTIKDRFRKIPEDVNELEDVLNAAQNQVKEDEKLWFAFSGSARAKFLKYLLELTTVIEKESLGLVVEKISISENGTLRLKAHVRGFDELQTLERELRKSKLLKNFEPVGDPNFEMIIRLPKEE
jgi:type IV pilus assembly protein PilM